MRTHIWRAVMCASAVPLVAPVLGVTTVSLTGGTIQLLEAGAGNSSALLIIGCVVALSLAALTLIALVLAVRAIGGRSMAPRSQEQA